MDHTLGWLHGSYVYYLLLQTLLLLCLLLMTLTMICACCSMPSQKLNLQTLVMWSCGLRGKHRTYSILTSHYILKTNKKRLINNKKEKKKTTTTRIKHDGEISRVHCLHYCQDTCLKTLQSSYFLICP